MSQTSTFWLDRPPWPCSKDFVRGNVAFSIALLLDMPTSHIGRGLRYHHLISSRGDTPKPVYLGLCGKR